MTHSAIKNLQRAMNTFTNANRGLGFAPLREDGDFGALTRKRIKGVKYYLGYLRKNCTTEVNDRFFKRMNHPNLVDPEWGQTKSSVKRGKRRRAHRRWQVRRNRLHSYLKPGVGTFDGRPVAKCAIPILNWCRDHGWHGVLVSGWRDPKYSQSLCYRMCGRPSCPGLCAGLSSNHVGNSPAKFAMDVSDYANFANVVARCPLKPHVHNSLPHDRVHFSPSGN